MKVFVSSVVAGFADFRSTAIEAVVDLGHRAITAEDFGASPTSPQRSCLAGVRGADAVVLVLGERYGDQQVSGLSATHEEYAEARDADKVLAFVQQGITPEPAQAALIDEVQRWEHGHYTAPFANPRELHAAITQALHRLELDRLAGPVDEEDIMRRGMASFGRRDRYGSSLELVTVGGPRTAVIRPGDLSTEELAQALAEVAVTGATKLFPIAGSGATHVVGDRLTFEHQLGSISIDELGTITIAQPPRRVSAQGHRGLEPIIHEDVEGQLTAGLRLAAALLDKVDPTARLRTIVPLARLSAGITAWMSRAEAEAVRGGAMTLNARGDAPAVSLTPALRRRSSLSADASGIARDLTARLRGAVVTSRGIL